MPIDFKKFIVSEIDRLSDKLWEISTAIFDEPEIAFKEFKACKLLSDSLADSGFTTVLGIGSLETAFRASFGVDRRPVIAILAEYDALPGLGHACGHNLIASAAIGAGVALAAIKPTLPGQIQVIGTPAEEGGGGKIILAQAGVFKSVDAVLMFHPASKNLVLRASLASSKLKLEFHGKSSHAAAAPEEGINALDAVILTFNNINVLRSTIGPKDRIAGIITQGGKAANIIPDYCVADFSIRSLSANRRDVLVDKVITCAKAGAQAVGCRLEYLVTTGYQEIIPNRLLAGLFKSNLESLGRDVVDPDPNERMGSTDMGDVSHIVPAIHPYLAIAPENVAGHTLEFKKYCISDSGKSAMLDAAKAIAMTVIDLLTDPALCQRAKDELSSALNPSKQSQSCPS
jgi:amidohydrolase